MTCCVAAMCEGGQKIVSATDGLLTYGGITAEALEAKMYWYGEWQFLYSGAPSNIGLVLEELRHIIDKDPEALSRAKVQTSTLNAYLSFVAKASSTSVLSPHGIGLDDFNRHGREWFGDDLFRDLHSTIQIQSNSLQDQMLVLGWGLRPHAAMIYEISGLGYTAPHDLEGMAAIGSGGDVALSTLLMLGQSRSSSLSETLYRVAAAKFMAESSAGVGKHTAMHVSWKKREADANKPLAGEIIQPDDVQALRLIWEEHGRPKIPDQARIEATRIVGKAIGTASFTDVASAINAGARLHNQPEGMALHEAEDDPGGTTAEEERKPPD